MEKIITILINIHAFCGGIGLITGIYSIIVKKGKLTHRRMGKIFSYSMIASSAISLVIAKMPKHDNQFLFLIGTFTIYLILAGNRALTLKNKAKADLTDKIISGGMGVVSVTMLFFGIWGIIHKIDNSILYLFFGGFGGFMVLRDFQTFKVFQKKKNAWLISHLGRMIGALIASVTAFLVAGLHIGSTLVWIAPTVIGTIYIIFWNRKLKKNK